jgi:hypothetical protein
MLDIFTVSTEIHTIEFQITECHPSEYCSITPSIEIHSRGRPLERREDDKANAATSWTSSASSPQPWIRGFDNGEVAGDYSSRKNTSTIRLYIHPMYISQKKSVYMFDDSNQDDNI